MGRKRTADIVMGKIVELIRTEEITGGNRLPSERELAAKFQVSRNSVREALRTLEWHGVLDIRRGGGSYVRESSRDVIQATLTETLTANKTHLVFEMLEVRRALEVEAASLAAQRANMKDLENIQLALEAMEVSIEEVEKGVQADLQFHLQIVEASHNSILIQLTKTMMDKLDATIRTTRTHRFQDPDRYEATWMEHKNIFVAIASGDSELAKDLVEQHISGVRRELSESLLMKKHMNKHQMSIKE